MTTWVERTAGGGAFQHGRPEAGFDAAGDYFIDVLFEGTPFFALMPWSGTERTIASTAQTERTIASTAWTKRSI